jgi:hypothetical protein
VSQTPDADTPTDQPEVVRVPVRRTYAPGDMVRSMLVILALVGLLLLIVPRPNKIPERSIDVPAAAQASAAQLGFAPAAPQLPAGWTPKTADVQKATDDRPTWHLSYVTPSSSFAGVQQTRDATDDWVARQVTDGADQGRHRAGGVDWTVRSRTDRGITSWVRTDGDVTTVVTGTAPAAELNQLAASVVSSSSAVASPSS